jgi:hypothetical protein
MRDPVRLSEQSESELESALLGAGSTYRGSSRARAKTLAALGLAASATAAASTASATSLGSLTKLTWLKIIAAVSVVGTVATPVGYYVSRRQSERAVVASSRTANGAAAAAGAGPEAPAPASDPASTSTPLPRTSRRAPSSPFAVRRDEKRLQPRPGTGSDTLPQEVVALDAVRTELARGDSRGALSLLNTYGRAYPHGDLVLEAEVLRIEALARSGRVDVAKKRAGVFLRRHPNSVLAARVRPYSDN